MSHTTVAHTRDYINGSSKGDFVDPANKSFDADPMLPQIKTSQLPHKILPDPTPSTDPELFDHSTNHPNKNYHHEKQLSKKKRAKKFGTQSAADVKVGNKGGNILSSKQNSKEKIDHLLKRDLTFEERDAMANNEHPKEGEEEEEDDEAGDDDDDSDIEERLTQSAQQNHENRLVGHENEKGLGVNQKNPAEIERAAIDEKKPKKKSEEKDEENENEKEGESGDKDASQSIFARATNLASSLTSKVTETLTAAKEKIVGKSGDDKSEAGGETEGEKTEESSDDSNKEIEGATK